MTPTILPVNSPGSFGNDGGINQPDAPSDTATSTAGGGGAGGVGGDGEGPIGGEGGIWFKL